MAATVTVPPADIPLVDLGIQHAEIADAVRDGFASVIERGAFVGGREVAAFEAAFAAFCGARHCVGVANGTDAIELLLRARGIGAGDEVIVPANTFVATIEAVIRAGARPVLADVDPMHLLIDSASAARMVTPRTRALLAVHLYGQMAPMAALRELCAPAGALLLEDAAQAHGATQNGMVAGNLGDGAAFSFYPGKNLGAFGDAGAVVTDDGDVARATSRLRDHGSDVRYEHVICGVNSRLDTLQAVVLSAKLPHLAAWNRQRRVSAQLYAELLASDPRIVLPSAAGGNEHAWHLYVIRVPRRDAVLAAMQREGIGVAVHYPRPVHWQPAFRDLGAGRDDLRVTEEASQQILSLPIFPGITEARQQRIVDALARALKSMP